MNKIIITGTIIYDIEEKEYGTAGKTLVNVSIASGLKQVNPKTGNKNTIYISVTAFGELGNFLLTNCKKGDKIIVTGELSFRLEQIDGKWKQTTAKITADDIELVVDNAKRPAPVQATQTTSMQDQQSMNVDASQIYDPFDDQ